MAVTFCTLYCARCHNHTLCGAAGRAPALLPAGRHALGGSGEFWPPACYLGRVISGSGQRRTGPGGTPGSGDDHPTFDTSVAHQARIYNYWLGGKDNYAADRKAAEEAVAAYPGVATGARANRQFLARAVRHLAGEAGIRQFLDIGTGIPTANNTQPILDQAARILDFSQPVAIMLIAIMHAIGDHDHPYEIVARLIGAVPPGSYLVLSHGASDIDAAEMAEVARRINRSSRQQFTPRGHAEVTRFFDGLDLLEPGVVRVEAWRPGSGPGSQDISAMWGGVAVKPG